MAMGIRKARGAVSEINMTPMIDVLLVLLVIFMVVQQGMQRGVPLAVPPPPAEAVAPPPAEQIVLEVEAGGAYRINRQPVAGGALEDEVARIFAGRPRKVLFVKGAGAASYGEVIRAADAARAAGVAVVGLVPRSAG